MCDPASRREHVLQEGNSRDGRPEPSPHGRFPGSRELREGCPLVGDRKRSTKAKSTHKIAVKIVLNQKPPARFVLNLFGRESPFASIRANCSGDRFAVIWLIMDRRDLNTLKPKVANHAKTPMASRRRVSADPEKRSTCMRRSRRPRHRIRAGDGTENRSFSDFAQSEQKWEILGKTSVPKTHLGNQIPGISSDLAYSTSLHPDHSGVLNDLQ